MRSSDMALCARHLALKGDADFLIDHDGLVPVADFEIKTRDGRPVAYRLSIPDSGGGRSETTLAAEVFHVRLAADPVQAWIGQAPLRRASLSAGLLHALEDALREVYTEAPLGSMVVPMPESAETDMGELGRSFRGRRGRVLIRESVSVTAAGGPVPQTDRRPSSTSPDMERSKAVKTFQEARDSILNVFGVLPSMLSPAATGPVVREDQRLLATWCLPPIARLIEEEAAAKLGERIRIDILGALQAYDAGGRARALSGITQAIALAKQSGLSPEEVAAAAAVAGVPSD